MVPLFTLCVCMYACSAYSSMYVCMSMCVMHEIQRNASPLTGALQRVYPRQVEGGRCGTRTHPNSVTSRRSVALEPGRNQRL